MINLPLTVNWGFEIVWHASEENVFELDLQLLFLLLLDLSDVNEQQYLHLFVHKVNLSEHAIYGLLSDHELRCVLIQYETTLWWINVLGLLGGKQGFLILRLLTCNFSEKLLEHDCAFIFSSLVVCRASSKRRVLTACWCIRLLLLLLCNDCSGSLLK